MAQYGMACRSFHEAATLTYMRSLIANDGYFHAIAGLGNAEYVAEGVLIESF